MVINLKKHSKIALLYFLIIALLGVLLRVFFVASIPAEYTYLVHTHSHVALLGWLYTGLTTLIYKFYLIDLPIEKKYKRIFWFTQVTIIGMLLSFPFTGYALFSIIFSTLFLIASYFFSWLVFKHTPKEKKQTNSYKCIRIALWYMIISSIGPWALGIIMNTLGNASDLYRNAIYFYLHFQYNGWFILALFGSLFYFLEHEQISISRKVFQRFFWSINSGAVLTLGISLLWTKPHNLVYIISGLGALLQLYAFGILGKELFTFRKEIQRKCTRLFYNLLKLTALLFLAKLILQFIGAIPYFAEVIAYTKDFVIGYLHWIFLGVVSIALLGFLNHFKLIQLSKNSMILYLIGFIATEVFIFYKGTVVWLKLSFIDYYFEYLVILSCILLIAIGNIFSLQFKKVTH